jgi:adenylate cyclase class 2
MKNIEVELKFPLKNTAKIQVFLDENAEFKYESFQHDEYYNPPHRDFLEHSENINEWLRIRVSGDKAQINYKDWQPHDATLKTHCIEFETAVESHEQLTNILTALNFVKLIDVKKTRRAWEYDDTEISIDDVEGLGGFIELEYKGELQDAEAARTHLFKVLHRLGAETGELDVRGYPYMLLKKKSLL